MRTRKHWTMHVRGSAALFVVGWILLVVACSVALPQQGWEKRRGPVVPHDTSPRTARSAT